MLRLRIGSDDGRVEVGNFFLADCQVPVEDIQKLALNPTDITLSEDASGECPVDVSEGEFICELDQGTRISLSRLEGR